MSLRTRGGGSPAISNAQLLIDTGADVTLLPRDAVLRLGLQPDAGGGYELISLDGKRTTADSVELDMIFLNKAFRGRYLLIDAQHGILGRDVLSAVALLMDGPKQEWSAA